MGDHSILAGNVCKQHGGEQIIMTQNGVVIPIVVKNGLSYITHYYPIDKQMLDVSIEEIMTSKND